MDLGLRGKHVLITGACQGIGLTTAEEFLREGAIVCITGRNKEKLKKAETYLKNKCPHAEILCFCGDTIDQQGIKRLFHEIMINWGELDVIVPNIGSGKPLTENPLDLNEWKRLFDVNLFGAIRLIDTFQALLKQYGGNIVMISSIVAKQVCGSSYAYAASKSAILSLVKYMARDFSKVGVRVNCVLPGNVFFQGGRWEELIEEKTQKELNDIFQAVPMNRFGKPEEISAGIVFLASDRASFITGSYLTIDGGQLSTIG